MKDAASSEDGKSGVAMSTIWEVRMAEKNVQEVLDALKQADAQDPNYFSVEESSALLRAIFPNYPDLHGMKPVPEIGAFLRTLRPDSCGTLAQST